MGPFRAASAGLPSSQTNSSLTFTEKVLNHSEQGRIRVTPNPSKGSKKMMQTNQNSLVKLLHKTKK